MRFGHVELFVADPMASKDFYADVLGFTVESVQGETFVWLSLGSLEVLLRPGHPEERSRTYQGAASALVLYTDHLSARREQLEARGLSFRGVDGSENCLTFQDLDGHWFQLVNPDEH